MLNLARLTNKTSDENGSKLLFSCKDAALMFPYPYTICTADTVLAGTYIHSFTGNYNPNGHTAISV